MKTNTLLRFLLLGFLLFSVLIFGKNINLDSLQEVIDSDAHDTIRLQTMSRVGWHYFERDYDKSMEVAYQMLRLSTKLARDVDIANAYNLIGSNYDPAKAREAGRGSHHHTITQFLNQSINQKD